MKKKFQVKLSWNCREISKFEGYRNSQTNRQEDSPLSPKAKFIGRKPKKFSATLETKSRSSSPSRRRYRQLHCLLALRWRCCSRWIIWRTKYRRPRRPTAMPTKFTCRTTTTATAKSARRYTRIPTPKNWRSRSISRRRNSSLATANRRKTRELTK